MRILTGDGALGPHLSRADDAGFVEALGERVALLGAPDGSLELWMWPLLVLEGLRLEPRRMGGVAAEPLGRRSVHVVPEGLVLEWDQGDYGLALEAFATADARELVLLLHAEGAPDLELELVFRPALRPMWPAGLGGRLAGRDGETGALYLSEELGRFAVLFGAPEAEEVALHAGRDLGGEQRLTLPISARRAAKGPVPVFLAGVERQPAPLSDAARRGGRQAACGASRAEAALVEARARYRALCADWPARLAAQRQAWRAALERGLALDASDPALARAHAWARVAVLRSRVAVDGVGRNLVAGLGPARGGDRPGFAWFFNGDALVASRAFAPDGDGALARDVLQAAVATQREDGKLSHEITLSAGLCDWFDDYPYAYYKGQQTPGFVACLGHYARWTRDLRTARALWPAARRALDWAAGTCDGALRMRVPLAGIAAVEAGPQADRIESDVYLQGIWISALREGAGLARVLGEDAEGERLGALATRAEAAFEGFWSEAEGRYGFARLVDGARCDDLTGYLGLPLARAIGEPTRAARSALALNRPELMSDWGVRMFSERSAAYDPEHYNTGSVFPYLTNFSALALFAHGYGDPAWQVLQSQLALAGFAGLGCMPEFLAGDRARCLPQAVPHQIFSEATILQSLCFGALGLERGWDGRLAFRPSPSPSLERIALARLTGGLRAELNLERAGDEHVLDCRLEARAGPWPGATIQPRLPPWTVVLSDEQTAGERGARRVQRLRLGPSVEYPSQITRDAPSRHPRLVGRAVGTKELRWTLAGPAGATVVLPLACGLDLTVEGAVASDGQLRVAFPPGEGFTEAVIAFRRR